MMGRRRVPAWLQESPPKKMSADKENKYVKAGEVVGPSTTVENHVKEAKPGEEIAPETKIESPPKPAPTLRRSSRSLTSKQPPPPAEEEKPIDYPPVKYDGKIKYFNEMLDIACACDELTQWVEKQESNVVPVGFDMEWPFSFKTGAGKSALIQVCCTLDVCYLFHLPKLKKLPAALIHFMNHKKVVLCGVNIKCDLRKLHRDFPEANVDEMVERCVDLGVWCNEVCSTGGRWSLERLVIYICKLQIDKNKKVRMSKWDVIPLDDNQLLYAAIDAYIAVVIYEELKRRHKSKQENEAKILEKYGQKALTEIKRLSVDLIQTPCLE